jgi:hypothetical protein
VPKGQVIPPPCQPGKREERNTRTPVPLRISLARRVERIFSLRILAMERSAAGPCNSSFSQRPCVPLQEVGESCDGAGDLFVSDSTANDRALEGVRRPPPQILSPAFSLSLSPRK